MPPPVEVIAAHRLGYGPRPQDVERIAKMGLEAYLDEQLKPDEQADPLCVQQLAAARLHIEYEAEKDDKGNVVIPSCKEDRGLTCLTATQAELWKRADGEVRQGGPERTRPLAEVKAATWIRGVYSRWQLREVMVDFWHNHFNVNTEMEDQRVVAMWPLYDRDVIRRHCLGNFRAFLEAVATSLPMLLYLNNSTSRASPANENYARELFELHSLGADHYFNHLYNRWRDVPGAGEGKPIGYIDQDVYEAARAFTGWTIADGSDSRRGDTFPRTGEFYYYDGWHDNYQKRVLGVEFEPNQPPMADGRKVLDLVARHPGTAQHVCGKICRRLVGENAPPELIDAAASTWTAQADAPDQIAQVIRTIVLSPAFASTWGQRVKRPLESAVALMRACDAQPVVGDELNYLLNRMGQRLFAWPAPTGHPEGGNYWLGSNAMICRWNAMQTILSEDSIAHCHLIRQCAQVDTWRKLCQFWVNRMLGRDLNESAFRSLLDYARGDADPDATIAVSDTELVERVHGVVTLVAMTPDFHTC